MWARLAEIFLRGHIQHRRIHAAAVALLLIRSVEGAASWVIVYRFFSGVTVSAWPVHLNFAVYVAAGCLFFFYHRREALTPALVWVDILANLAPMALAAHWSGGVYSPLLPIFVIKIVSYGLIFGVDIGLQSLATAIAAGAALVAVEQLAWAPTEALDQVPLVVRQRLTLAFEGLIFSILVGGGLRFFRILQDRENRLATAVGEKDVLYQTSLRQQEHLRRLSQGMMQVSERTMRRLARELHDDLGQALTAVKMDLGMIERGLPADSPIRAHVRETRDQIGAVLHSVRNLSQLLHPAVLDDLGLVPAIQSYIARFGERTGIAITLEAPAAETRLPRRLEVALYRVLQEALTNVARHASARGVNVRLQVDDATAKLAVIDDGDGFDAAKYFQAPPPGHGMGVAGMRERVGTFGGDFAITSHPGAGTRVELTIPLTQPIEETEDEYGEDSRLVG